jgi:hypothetical protein
MRSILLALCLCVGLVGLGLTPTYGEETKKAAPQGNQQQVMKACTDQANALNLSGAARSNFMTTCLKG